MTHPLVALTCYYNPFRGQRRLQNYALFRRRLGVPLVAVEWAQDGRFELTAADADVLIQVSGGDLLWQKERLLNLGLARIRADGLARDVVMMDADIVFASDDWARQISLALDGAPLAQGFARVDYLSQLPPQDYAREALAAMPPERTLPSLGYALARGASLFSSDPGIKKAMAHTLKPSSGLGGMSVALRLAAAPHFEFYDGNIVGGGDLLMVSAFVGGLRELFENRNYSAAHMAHAQAWAARCLPPGMRFGFADNRVLHLWHGALEDRQYGQRMTILGPRGYDPVKHLDRSGAAMRFTEGAGEIREAVGAYLASRADA